MRRCFLKKKQVHASEQKREDVAQARKEWKEKQESHVELPVDKLVFLDESGVNIDMVRRYGRAKNKNRVNDYAPVNTPKKTTLVSSVRLDGTQAYEFFQGSLYQPLHQIKHVLASKHWKLKVSSDESSS